MSTVFYDIEIFHTYDEAYQERMYTGWLDRSVRMSADVSFISHFGYIIDNGQSKCVDLTDIAYFDPKNPAKNEKFLLSKISKIFSEATHLVAHYGDKFDRRYLNAKFLQHGLPPIPPHPLLKQTDTCSLARKHLKLSSNRLDTVAKFLQVQQKRDKTWPDEWLKMTKGNIAAFKRINYYCKGDVETLKQVYEKLRPFLTSVPSKNLIYGGKGCPECQSGNIINYGFYYSKMKVYQRYRCKNCGFLWHNNFPVRNTK